MVKTTVEGKMWRLDWRDEELEKNKVLSFEKQAACLVQLRETQSVE